MLPDGGTVVDIWKFSQFFLIRMNVHVADNDPKMRCLLFMLTHNRMAAAEQLLPQSPLFLVGFAHDSSHCRLSFLTRTSAGAKNKDVVELERWGQVRCMGSALCIARIALTDSSFRC